LWLVAHTFERDAVRVKVGAQARLQFVARPGKVLLGQVLAIGPRVDPVSRTLDLRIAIDDPEQLVRPGMTATAALPIGDDATPVLAVPLRGVQRVGEAWVVFVPGNEAGTFAIHPIGRGRDLGDRVEVLSGIAPGATIVVDGAFLLKAQAAKTSGGGHHDH
jgi:cobalt-zinc-cadmium efflux system membrane fusion protein